jgi:hypothetical protein
VSLAAYDGLSSFHKSRFRIAHAETFRLVRMAQKTWTGTPVKKIAIWTSGPPAWLRYLIVQEGGRFWDGKKWTRQRRRARLYADDQDVALVFRELEDWQYKDKPLRTFQAPLNIRLRADQDIDINTLGGYLQRVVAILIDLQRVVAILIDQDRCGTGPVPDSVVQLDVTWADIREVNTDQEGADP